MKKKTAAIILAAGQGTRMKSRLPKVLHPVAGTPMVAHVVHLALERGCGPVVVVIDKNGRRIREALVARFPKAPLHFAVQEQQRGTGDATRTGLAAIPEFRGRVLLLYGDVPLLSSKTVSRLERAANGRDMALLSAVVDQPRGYGRVVREGKDVVRVVEDRDATDVQRDILEINVGVYVFEERLLRKAVEGLDSNNAQGEFYLTDVVSTAAKKGGVGAVCTEDLEEITGVNDRYQLAEAEVLFRHRAVLTLMDKGVTFRDPNSTFIDADVKVGKDVVIGVGVQLYGRTSIGAGAVIEGPTVIRDCSIGAGAQVHSFSHLEGAEVARAARIGPFARLRPGADIGVEARVGNFVEVKKATLGKGAKANHLAYIGDADIGADSNIGAGTITCNYDGASKHRTVLGKGCFTGSNSTLVAPLELGPGSYVAAGSTVTRDVPKDALAFGRARQVNRDGYALHLRRRLSKEAK